MYKFVQACNDYHHVHDTCNNLVPTAKTSIGNHSISTTYMSMKTGDWEISMELHGWYLGQAFQVQI